MDVGLGGTTHAAVEPDDEEDPEENAKRDAEADADVSISGRRGRGGAGGGRGGGGRGNGGGEKRVGAVDLSGELSWDAGLVVERRVGRLDLGLRERRERQSTVSIGFASGGKKTEA
jgi:hypothetical protein